MIIMIKIIVNHTHVINWPTHALILWSTMSLRMLGSRISLHCMKLLQAGCVAKYSTNTNNSRVWSLGKLNHVAIAVPNLEKATSLYRDVLGASVSKVTPLPEHGVYTVFIELGNTKIELLHPLGENSPIEAFLKKKPDGGMHHICIEVDNIMEAMKSLEGKIRVISSEPKIGAHGKPVVFLHPKDCDGVLIELEQE